MSGFQTSMQATVRVPQEGFTVKELKDHLSASKIPAEARLKPTTVTDVDPEPDPEQGGVQETRRELGFIAEWVQ